MRTNLRHTIYKKLFISEADAASIRSDAIDILNRDASFSVCNAYIEATLNYLDAAGLLDSLDSLDADRAVRLAELAERAKK